MAEYTNNYKDLLQAIGGKRLIVIDGLAGEGKTYLCNQLLTELVGHGVHLDMYLTNKVASTDIIELLDAERMNADIFKVLDHHPCCIVEGVLMDNVLAELNQMPDLTIFVSHKVHILPWQEGGLYYGKSLGEVMDMVKEERGAYPQGLRYQELQYMCEHRPFETADYVYERPKSEYEQLREIVLSIKPGHA